MTGLEAVFETGHRPQASTRLDIAFASTSSDKECQYRNGQARRDATTSAVAAGSGEIARLKVGQQRTLPLALTAQLLGK